MSLAVMNPDFDRIMKRRRAARQHNQSARAIGLHLMPVPKQPNKYLPHIGAKEAVRYVGKSLGPNASRVLQKPVVVKDMPLSDKIMRSALLRPGATVTWTSSGKTKTGEIVAVVPVGEHPKNDFKPKVDISGAPRDHTSYVVKADGKHYWPRVSLLNLN